ncbi:hypothetical protein GCWU000342_02259 [Shuttleworthella satelles DSM 14600]|uniref:Uncharacterized protein n=1 Tax=Shuttleworthella satelles DSM 14600 TaxID=626523 RepID=C4GDT5_9FIRM|nr:hypothetical protein GCWU000342_02259 [Shuttleworthia satelles DSM 14600]
MWAAAFLMEGSTLFLVAFLMLLPDLLACFSGRKLTCRKSDRKIAGKLVENCRLTGLDKP